MDNHPRKTWAAGRSSTKRLIRTAYAKLGDTQYVDVGDTVIAEVTVVQGKPRYAGGHHSDARYSSKHMIAKPGRTHHTTE